jgi:hypothetical protein
MDKPILPPDEVFFSGPFDLWPRGGCWQPAEFGGAPGVYLLTIPVGDGFRTFYVGEGEWMVSRLRWHLACYLAGQYNLYDPTRLLTGTLQVSWSPKKGEIEETTLANLDDHRRKLEEMMRLVRVFLCSLPESTQAIRQRVESAIIKALRDETEANAFLENERLSVNVRSDHKTVAVRQAASLFSIPSTLEV